MEGTEIEEEQFMRSLWGGVSAKIGIGVNGFYRISMAIKTGEKG